MVFLNQEGDTPTGTDLHQRTKICDFWKPLLRPVMDTPLHACTYACVCYDARTVFLKVMMDLIKCKIVLDLLYCLTELLLSAFLGNLN